MKYIRKTKQVRVDKKPLERNIMDPIFEIHDLDDVIEVVNSDLQNIRAAESPPQGTQPPCYIETRIDSINLIIN